MTEVTCLPLQLGDFCFHFNSIKIESRQRHRENVLWDEIKGRWQPRN